MPNDVANPFPGESILPMVQIGVHRSENDCWTCGTARRIVAITIEESAFDDMSRQRAHQRKANHCFFDLMRPGILENTRLMQTALPSLGIYHFLCGEVALRSRS